MKYEDLKKRLYVPNYDEWETDCQMNFYSDKELTVKTIENGIILPPKSKNNSKLEYSGGVCDESFNFVDGFYEKKIPGMSYEIRSSYKCDENEIMVLGENVIWGGVLRDHFGHIILEYLTKIWYVLKNSNHKEKIAFVRTTPNSKLIEDGIAYKILNLLDIPSDRIIIVDRPTKFKSIIIPESSAHIYDEYTKEYLLPYHYICNKIKPSTYKKIYLTRRKFSNPIMNEVYFEEYFSKRGYKIISPEQLSLEEQVSLISGAEEIAATVGTLTHWALFCKPGTKFIMLLRDSNLLLPQCLINDATKIDWYIINASLDFFSSDHFRALHIIGATSYWREFVREHFNDVDINDESFEKYILKYIVDWGKLHLNPNMYRFSAINFIRDMDIMTFFRPLYDMLKDRGLPYELNQYLEADFDELSKKFEIETLVVFGAGNIGKNVMKAFIQSKYKDIKMYFCDNDSKKWGSSINIGGGYQNIIEVISPNELVKNYTKSLVVIGTSSYVQRTAIYNKLLQLGYPKERIKIVSKLNTLEPFKESVRF